MFRERKGADISPCQAWYTENLQISVPVTVVAGLFVVMMIVYCFRGVSTGTLAFDRH